MNYDYLMKYLSHEEERVKNAIKEILEIDNNDAIIFEFIGMKRITEQNDYHGLRIKLIGSTGRSKTPIFVDLGVGM